MSASRPVSLESLLATQASLAVSLDACGIARWRLDIPARVLRVSRNLPVLMGIPAVAAHHRPVQLLHHLPRVDRQALWNVAMAAIERRGAFEHLLRIQTDALLHRWVLIRGRCQADPAGRATNLAGVVINVTSHVNMEQAVREDHMAVALVYRQHMEERMRRMNASLGQVGMLERQRLARLLHDNLQQLIFGAKLRMPIIRKALDPPHVEVLEQAELLLQQAIGTARDLSVELSPPILRQGLTKALRWLAHWMREHHRLRVTVRIDGGVGPLDDTVGDLLFQAVREMLFNVVKHARTDRAALSMTRTDEAQLRLVIRDVGQGFDLRALAGTPPTGFGLATMRERIELLGGQMTIVSHPGQGTTVTVLVPLDGQKSKPTRKRGETGTRRKNGT